MNKGINFSKEDLDSIVNPHEDPLVIQIDRKRPKSNQSHGGQWKLGGHTISCGIRENGLQ